MKTFAEAINEGKVSIEDTPFVVSVYNDNKGLAIQFLFAKSGDIGKWGANEAVKKLENSLNKALPQLDGSFYYESGNYSSAGYVFRMYPKVLADYLTKYIK
jgi:hypothetical protein